MWLYFIIKWLKIKLTLDYYHRMPNEYLLGLLKGFTYQIAKKVPFIKEFHYKMTWKYKAYLSSCRKGEQSFSSLLGKDYV